MGKQVKVGRRVYTNNGLEGKVTAEDINNTSSPRLPNEKLWVIRWENGTVGGGWRTGELNLI